MRQLVIVILLTSAVSLQAARLDGPPDRARDAQRRWVLEHMRIAAADRLIERDDEIAAYIAAQFNTVVLYDTENGLLKSEERIAFEIGFARSHGLHVLLGKATESVHAAHHSRRPFALSASGEVSDDEIRDRLALWDTYGHDLIAGVFFLHDDAFLIHATAERQRHLYELSHDVVRDWPVFGMIGGGGIEATAEEIARYYDRDAFDDLIVIVYPFNVAISIFDDVQSYIDDYLSRIGSKFVLKDGQQMLIVIQAFAYEGEEAAHVPLGANITAEAAAVRAALQRIDGQQRNASLAYFLWDGSRAGMFGLWQRRDWIDAAQQVNNILARDGGIVVRDGVPRN